MFYHCFSTNYYYYYYYVYLIRIHGIVPVFFILLTFEGHRSQSSKGHQYLAHFVTI
jgi:hypothetical protein